MIEEYNASFFLKKNYVEKYKQKYKNIKVLIYFYSIIVDLIYNDR